MEIEYVVYEVYCSGSYVGCIGSYFCFCIGVCVEWFVFVVCGLLGILFYVVLC